GTRIAASTDIGRFAAVIGGDMPETLRSDVHRLTGWSIALSVLMIIAGILAIASPFVAGLAVTRIVGWLLLFSGFLHFVYAFRGGTATAVLWEILVGGAYLLIGGYIPSNTAIALAPMTFAIARSPFAESLLASMAPSMMPDGD